MPDLRKDLRVAVRELRSAKVKRDRLIYRAARGGMTERQIAEATSLSPGRVHQIISNLRARRLAQPGESVRKQAEPPSIFREKPPRVSKRRSK